jgi:eukaryotic-like serine/threonine-protein kinase
MNEGQLATKIQHENVLRVLFFHDGRKYEELPPYMIMEFADGGTLEKILNEKRVRNEFFRPEELRSVLVHRDIKPEIFSLKKTG